MKNKNLVSVIIPTYGRGKTILEAVESVLTQTYQHIEIIIVDDNSDILVSDEVKSALSHLIKNEKVTYYWDGINRGGAGARNKGIELCNGSFITFLDDDDLFLQDKIEKQFNFLIANNLDVCVCDMLFQENDSYIDVKNCYARVDSLKHFILDGNCYTPMIFIRKEVLRDVGGFTLTPRYQDHLLMLKILEHTNKIARLPEKLFVHNNHEGYRITFSDKSIQAYELRNKLERRHLNLLNSKELKIFEFKQSIMQMKISRLKNNWPRVFIEMFNALRNLRTIAEMYSLMKAVVRVLLFGKKII